MLTSVLRGVERARGAIGELLTLVVREVAINIVEFAGKDVVLVTL